MSTGIKNLLLKTFRNAEEASATLHLDPEKANRAGFRVVVVCITGALCLTMNAYLARNREAQHALVGWLGGADWIRWIDHKDNLQFARVLWWAGMVIFSQLVVPMLVVKWVLREKLASYGFRLRGAFTDWPIYLFAAAVVMPLAWFASANPGFLARYPFYSPPPGVGLWPTFAIWEAAYILQFAALEFFFRGFMLHGTKDRFGFYAIFVMTIPYCMIHFTKPFPETLAAIVAGIVLGIFSLKSGSIASGFLLHCGAALSMDFAALFRKGLL